MACISGHCWQTTVDWSSSLEVLWALKSCLLQPRGLGLGERLGWPWVVHLDFNHNWISGSLLGGIYSPWAVSKYCGVVWCLVFLWWLGFHVALFEKRPCRRPFSRLCDLGTRGVSNCWLYSIYPGAEGMESVGENRMSDGKKSGVNRRGKESRRCWRNLKEQRKNKRGE